MLQKQNKNNKLRSTYWFDIKDKLRLLCMVIFVVTKSLWKRKLDLEMVQQSAGDLDESYQTMTEPIIIHMMWLTFVSK